MSNQIDIDALERAALAATPGPWRVQHTNAGSRGFEVADDTGLEQICADVTEERAAYIAAANPAAVIELIRQLRNAHHQRDILLAPLKAMTSKGRIPPTSDMFHRARHAVEKVEGGAA